MHICALELQLLACPYHPGVRLPRIGLRVNMATAPATPLRHMCCLAMVGSLEAMMVTPPK